VTVVQVREVRKQYGELVALDGVSLEVAEQEVVALLGPNGAGKTTLVEILEGYRRRDAGTVEVLGFDPATGGRAFRERIGIVLQEAGFEEQFSVRELLRLQAGCFPHPRPADEGLAMVGPEVWTAGRLRTLSGGQRRRLDLGLGIIGDPEVLFLDEPTTGFDPSARRNAWDLVDRLRDLGATILLTTHYLDEAEHLADRVVVLDHGRVVVEGTPAELAAVVGRGSRVSFALPDGVAPADWARTHGLDPATLEVERPSLEEVYLELTGGAPEEAEP
jgi:ABC-2 type transport system ATP-binding protein